MFWSVLLRRNGCTVTKSWSKWRAERTACRAPAQSSRRRVLGRRPERLLRYRRHSNNSSPSIFPARESPESNALNCKKGAAIRGPFFDKKTFAVCSCELLLYLRMAANCREGCFRYGVSFFSGSPVARSGHRGRHGSGSHLEPSGSFLNWPLVIIGSFRYFGSSTIDVTIKYPGPWGPWG